MKRPIRALLVGLVALLGIGGAGLSWLRYQADHDPRYADVVSIASAPVYQDAALLERAWALPVAAAYGALEYQANPSFCGPTSAANVLRSLGMIATQSSVIEGSAVRPILGYLPMGLTLDEEAELLRDASDRPVTVLRDLSLEDFRAHMARTNDTSLRYVVNFNRAPLWGSGHGHISPILGYLAPEDLVFVGDVNGDYRPFLVATERLWEAVNTVDSATGLNRGLIVIAVEGELER